MLCGASCIYCNSNTDRKNPLSCWDLNSISLWYKSNMLPTELFWLDSVRGKEWESFYSFVVSLPTLTEQDMQSWAVFPICWTCQINAPGEQGALFIDLLQQLPLFKSNKSWSRRRLLRSMQVKWRFSHKTIRKWLVILYKSFAWVLYESEPHAQLIPIHKPKPSKFGWLIN